MSTQPDGTLDNPYPYSQYSYGMKVNEPTYFVNGLEKFVLEPALVPGQINTPMPVHSEPIAEAIAFFKAWEQKHFGL